MSALIELTGCAYGKTGVRLVKVERHGSRHSVKDINVGIRVFGAFEGAYSGGDNRSLLPTDTMKNTVYVLARQPLGEIEDFGLRLAKHLLARNSHLTRVQATVSENIWERIQCGGEEHDTSFQMSGPEIRTALIDADCTKITIHAGIKSLAVLKTSQSAFENFLRDEYTTLKETRDRLFASSVNAEWSYNTDVRDFRKVWQCARAILLHVFAAHDSHSVQHTLYAMGAAVLQQVSSIEQIQISMPNRHCVAVDLSPFHLDNPNEVFVPIEEPGGLIEATLKRGTSSITSSRHPEGCP